jgi:hypothetical protein
MLPLLIQWVAIIGTLALGTFLAWQGGSYATDYRFIPHSFNAEGGVRWASRFMVWFAFRIFLRMPLPHLAFKGWPLIALALLLAWLIPSAVMKAAIDLEWFRMRMRQNPGVFIPWFRPSTPWEIQRRQ